jgi:3-hydroxyisobutyrate dehydrogenase-like beta-hydroxyacid dehydrogenase
MLLLVIWNLELSRQHTVDGRGFTMRIGFLGLGKMGTPMALRLVAAGHELSVWNRTEGRTKPLLHEGAIAAATPAEAELGADAVITMLLDDAAYEEVFFGVHRLIDALSPGVLHALCGTISVGLAERLTVEHAKRGIDFVGAPVFGTPSDAEDGQLWVVVAGAEKAMERARPLLEAFSRGITVAGNEPKLAFAKRLGKDFSPTP